MKKNEPGSKKQNRVLNTKGKKRLFSAACGLAVGLINGLLGAGGGMLAVPLLKKAGLSQQEAHASSIAVILPLSMVSAVLYWFAGRTDLSKAWIYMPSGVVGAVLGALLLHKLPARWLRRCFGVFMLWAGVRLLTH